jgi:hypothetical protein
MWLYRDVQWQYTGPKLATGELAPRVSSGPIYADSLHPFVEPLAQHSVGVSCPSTESLVANSH